MRSHIPLSISWSSGNVIDAPYRVLTERKPSEFPGYPAGSESTEKPDPAGAEEVHHG